MWDVERNQSRGENPLRRGETCKVHTNGGQCPASISSPASTLEQNHSQEHDVTAGLVLVSLYHRVLKGTQRVKKSHGRFMKFPRDNKAFSLKAKLYTDQNDTRVDVRKVHKNRSRETNGELTGFAEQRELRAHGRLSAAGVENRVYFGPQTPDKSEEFGNSRHQESLRVKV